ncbi:hypothetical protein DSECCO2_337420 [anaerobic digester metagenome]
MDRVFIGGSLLVNPGADRLSLLVLAGDRPVHDPSDFSAPRDDPAAETLRHSPVLQGLANSVPFVWMDGPGEERGVGSIGLGGISCQVLAGRGDVRALSARTYPRLEVGRRLENPGEEPLPSMGFSHPGDERSPPPGVLIHPGANELDWAPVRIERDCSTVRGREQERVESPRLGNIRNSFADGHLETKRYERLEQGVEPFNRTDCEEARHGRAPYGRI